MVRVVTQNQDEHFDYVFNNLEDFYETTKFIYKPILADRYSIQLNLSNINDIKSIILNEVNYSHFDIIILTTKDILKRLQLMTPNNEAVKELSAWDYYNLGIQRRGLLFHKDLTYALYTSLDKSFKEIDDALDFIQSITHPLQEITIEFVEPYYPITNIVYPRNVLVQFIKMGEWRWHLLKKSISQVGADIVLNATIKQIQAIHHQKCRYLKGKIENDSIVTLNTDNINLLYYIFYLKKCYGIRDITILYNIYERKLYNDF